MTRQHLSGLDVPLYKAPSRTHGAEQPAIDIECFRVPHIKRDTSCLSFVFDSSTTRCLSKNPRCAFPVSIDTLRVGPHFVADR